MNVYFLISNKFFYLKEKTKEMKFKLKLKYFITKFNNQIKIYKLITYIINNNFFPNQKFLYNINKHPKTN